MFLKNKGKKGKCTSTPKSTPKNAPRNAPKSLKDGKKAARKKVKAAAADEPTVLSFLERAQERDEAFMERMAEAEREGRREQQKFSMDVLKMLGNILKDVDFMYHDKMLDQDNYICSRTVIPDMMNIKKAKIIAIVSAII